MKSYSIFPKSIFSKSPNFAPPQFRNRGAFWETKTIFGIIYQNTIKNAKKIPNQKHFFLKWSIKHGLHLNKKALLRNILMKLGQLFWWRLYLIKLWKFTPTDSTWCRIVWLTWKLNFYNWGCKNYMEEGTKFKYCQFFINFQLITICWKQGSKKKT
jgi:hypothetical protein